jgi:UrcA family protein
MDGNAQTPRCRWLALLPAAILSMTACFGLPVLARDRGTVHVQLSDLDLTTPEGRRIANERIRRAASDVCSRVADWEDLGRDIHIVRCVKVTIAKVTESMQLPLAQSKARQVAQSQIP